MTSRGFGWFTWMLGLVVFMNIMAPAGIEWWQTMLAVIGISLMFIGSDLLNKYPRKNIAERRKFGREKR